MTVPGVSPPPTLLNITFVRKHIFHIHSFLIGKKKRDFINIQIKELERRTILYAFSCNVLTFEEGGGHDPDRKVTFIPFPKPKSLTQL